jgi:DNA processing protein
VDQTPEIIRLTDTRYPALLRTISDPPERLFCRGNTELLQSFCIAVVGTRKASEYGRQATQDIAGNLAMAGVTIVSGLAAGIDGVAHRAALNNKGATIAVFGTGTDDADIFPADHLSLAHDILAGGGLLMSEYPPGTHGQRFTFPTRNRIISGLSRGTLVVEADMKSGSIITARSALDQNRDVFAVPGSIYWPRSVGSNWLIAQGARPVQTAADILQSYALRQGSIPGTDTLSTEDPVQRAILQLLRESGPTHLDTLIAQCGTDASRTMTALTMLELQGSVKTVGAGIYTTT